MIQGYTRWQAESAQKALKNRRVVAISGARQTGKTTLTRQVIVHNGTFRSLDSAALLQAASDDPNEFVKNSSSGTMVIDEIQKVPELMSEIKLAVDKDNRPGQYLITGSANLQTIAHINDSLAGRIKHIRLRPLAVGEILGKKPTFLQRVFAGTFPVQIKGYDKDAIFDLAFCGGYPEALRINNPKERKEWHRDYVDSLIKKDLNDLEKIRRLDTVRDLVKILAGWSGKYMDKSQISAALEVSRPTLEAYSNALEALFIFERVVPWLKTDYDLAGKRSKIYITDTGLMASLLGWKREDVVLNADRSGKLMETFVFQELAAQIDLDSDYSLYQYRDAKKREIDFIVEKEGEGVAGFEVKASRSVSKEDFAPQIWFRDNIIKDKMPYKGIVLYSGEDILSFGDGMIAVPIAAFWSDV
ncbi:MAG: ATP-binding protein [Treponema sp.]|nr:ATP-binding protein [Treponema sp.]